MSAPIVHRYTCPTCGHGHNYDCLGSYGRNSSAECLDCVDAWVRRCLAAYNRPEDYEAPEITDEQIERAEETIRLMRLGHHQDLNDWEYRREVRAQELHDEVSPDKSMPWLKQNWGRDGE